MLPQAGAVGDRVRYIALVEGAGEEDGGEGAERVHGDVFAAVCAPAAGYGGTVHLVAVLGLRGGVEGDDTGAAVAGAVAVEDGGVGLEVHVGDLAIGACEHSRKLCRLLLWRSRRDIRPSVHPREV